MTTNRSLPRARRDGLLEETLGEELLLYDQNSHIAHCLSPIAARVWWHCDGERDLTGLAQLVGASKDLVADALHELHEKDLLAAEPELMQSTVPGISRREAIVRVARYGAAAAGASMIVSATAATPAMASSGEERVVCKTGSGTCCLCEQGVCSGAAEASTESTCIEYCTKKKLKKVDFNGKAECHIE
ncbi:MAG TPA: hypothetical protein VK691_12800 [Solirubrobacteraceae bacterium]|jgi:hypothetical protein|nr:hypothetical protein [Solirubrobacteraceae bacterium]